ncbi:IS3 family transposase [Streptomyces polygonati]|uniref:IS3 family transposase n=1 Tax=Streptomyces polygonati TaxID=1617087 RepID=A0ABV8HN17_9ACTN
MPAATPRATSGPGRGHAIYSGETHDRGYAVSSGVADRAHASLQRGGSVCGRRRVARLMRAAGVAGRHRRRRPDHRLRPTGGHSARSHCPDQPADRWAGPRAKANGKNRIGVDGRRRCGLTTRMAGSRPGSVELSTVLRDRTCSLS